MEFNTLEYAAADGVATITINRPEAANSLTREMCVELMQASIEVDDNPDVRAVVLRGAGRFFCTGADLRGFPPAGPEMATYVKEMTTYLHAAVSRFTRMDAPMITAINGTAAGAGMSLALIGDLAIAAETSRFTMAYSRIGLTPDGSSTYFLPRMVGLRRSLELCLTNRMLSAQEALQWGMINRVVADDELAAAADTLARQLAAGPTESIGAAKRLYHLSFNEGLESQMEWETRAISEAARRPEAKEGVAAFFEKRDPSFR